VKPDGQPHLKLPSVLKQEAEPQLPGFKHSLSSAVQKNSKASQILEKIQYKRFNFDLKIQVSSDLIWQAVPKFRSGYPSTDC